MTSRFIAFTTYTGQFVPGNPQTLREFSAYLMSGPDPVPYNSVDWLESFNNLNPDDQIGQNFTYLRWQLVEDYSGDRPQIWTVQQILSTFSPNWLVPNHGYGNTLRALADYLAKFELGAAGNDLNNLCALNRTGPDTPLPVRHGPVFDYMNLVANMWVLGTPGGSSSSGKPKRYLRMQQRDDGMGIERHPRLAGTGINNPSSGQSGRPGRLGLSNRYF